MKIGLVDAMSWAKLSPAGLGSEASLEDGDHTHGYAASAFPVPALGGLWGLTSRELTVWPEAAEGGREGGNDCSSPALTHGQAPGGHSSDSSSGRDSI